MAHVVGHVHPALDFGRLTPLLKTRLVEEAGGGQEGCPGAGTPDFLPGKPGQGRFPPLPYESSLQ